MALAQAITWSFMAEIAAKAIQPVVILVLAAFLAPEEFGVLAAAVMVIGFSQIFWEAGMSKALIQRQSDIQIAANVAFTVNLLLAAAICTVLFVESNAIAETFFRDPRVAGVLRVMTLQVMLSSLSAVPIALLQKHLEFKRLFWVRVATVSVPGLASIPLAWAGFSYWSLVVGTLVGHTIQVALLWKISSWRPTADFSAPIARELLQFAAWVCATGLLAWFYAWGDSLIVGLYLGSHELGLYRTGNQITLALFGVLFGPVVPVLYSHLSRMRGDVHKVTVASVKVIRALSLLAIPLGLILFSLSEPIGGTLFTSEWSGIGLVIGLMGLTHGFTWIVGMNGEVYRALSVPAYETLVPAVTLPLYLLVYFVAIHQGLETFLWARFGLAVLGVALHLVLFGRLLKTAMSSILRFLALVLCLSSIEVFLIYHLFVSRLDGYWAQLFLGGFAIGLAVFGSLYLLERRGIIQDVRAVLASRGS